MPPREDNSKGEDEDSEKEKGEQEKESQDKTIINCDMDNFSLP